MANLKSYIQPTKSYIQPTKTSEEGCGVYVLQRWIGVCTDSSVDASLEKGAWHYGGTAGLRDMEQGKG